MSLNSSDKTFVYITILNKDHSPGVYRKILGTVEGATHNGFKARLWCERPDRYFLQKISNEIIYSSEKVLFIRSICEYNIFLIPALLKAKRKGKILIFDIPTPNRVAFHEIYKSEKKFIGKLKALLSLLVSGPFPYMLADRCIQYANEGKWFMLGNQKKTKLIGNGIDVSNVPTRNVIPVWPSKELNLIAVASLNYWHGFDRIIYAIKKFNDDNSQNYKVNLTIIGEGSAYPALRKLVEDTKLGKHIIFKGYLTGIELYKLFEKAHIGVGSLGLFRKNLNEAAELKAREYTAIGIPFIASGNDPDFPESIPFRYKVSNSEEIDSILNFFYNVNEFISKTQNYDIRNYAVKKLDFKVKFKEIIKGI